MKPKTLALLCVAVGCGLVAMIGVQQAMNKPSAAKVETIQVLQAIDAIDPGVPLTEELVVFREIPRDAAPEDCITRIEEYQQRSLTVAVVKGDYILKGKLSDKGVSGKSIQIPIGKTAVTINVDETQTASGMVKAGDKVDVTVTYDARTPTGVQTKTMTLLECVTIFAIADQTKNDMAKRTDTNAVKARQVSLIVEYDQANWLVLAERKGQLRLLWRNPLDTAIRSTRAVTDNLLSELRGLDTGSRERPLYGESDEAPPESPVIAAEPEQKPDVQQFLAQPAPVAVEPQPAADPSRPTWDVKVYVGNDVQSYAFEMTEAKKNEEAAGASTTSTNSGGLLDRFGWSLPWTARKAPTEEPAATNQAL
ncbi:MAG: Flp pilus assembly protein CpaB [Planctomyces sp.]|nr:Flp pilus assembly protein CpaB [Planctomyces sp.]